MAAKKLLRIVLLLAAMLCTTSSWAHVITLTTAKKAGETLNFTIEGEEGIIIYGAEQQDSGTTYTVTSFEGKIRIIGRITSFKCSGNKITKLDVSGSLVLTELDCSRNEITELVLNKRLKKLDCSENKLTKLDLSKCVDLNYLDCSKNKLSSKASLEKLIASLPDLTTSESKGTIVIVNFLTEYTAGNYPKEENICDKLEVAALLQRGWKAKERKIKWGILYLSDYAGSNPVDASGVITITTTKKKGSGIFLEVTANRDIFTVEGAKPDSFLKDLFIIEAEDGVITLRGAITGLVCNRNSPQITQLDVSKCPLLQSLNCSGNELSTLNLVRNTQLQQLSCIENRFTSLNLQFNTLLKELSCAENQLSSLNISKNTALEKLSCEKNQITSLDLSKNAHLKKLVCSENKITGVDVSQNTLLEELSCEKNQISSLDLSKNTLLKKLECNHNQLSSIDLSNNPQLVELRFTDNKISSIDLSSLALLKTLNCSRNQLSSIDVSNNSELQNFFCNGNPLASLNISNNKKLKNLGFNNVQLTSIDVSNNFWLEGLWCDKNQLTTLNLSQNPNLKILNCTSNSLSTLDLSQNKNLEELNCGNNPLSTLNLSQNTNLKELNCANSSLPTLDLSQNTNLKELDCSGNQFSMLDFSNNSAIKTIYCGSNQIKDEHMDALIGSLHSEGGSITLIDRIRGEERNICTVAQVNKLKDKNWKVFEVSGISEYFLIPIPIEYNGDDGVFSSQGVITMKTEKKVGEHFSLYLSSIGPYRLEGVGYDKEKGYSVVTEPTGEIKLKGSFKSVDVRANQLTSLICEGQSDLEHLSCVKNRLNDPAAVNALIASLPDRNQKDPKGTLVFVDFRSSGSLSMSSGEENILDKNQVTDIRLKGWIAMEYKDDYRGRTMKEEYLGSEPVKNSIALTTSKKVGDDLQFTIKANGNVTIRGAKHKENDLYTLTAESGKVFIQGAVTELSCPNNELVKIDVSQNTLLKTLMCHYNRLTELNLSRNVQLTTLDCTFNELTSLNLSRNKQLKLLSCSKNRLSGETDMDALIASLPDRSTSEEKGIFEVVDFNEESHGTTLPKEGNVCNKNQVAAARRRGWQPKERKNADTGWSMIDYEGSEVVAIEEAIAEENAATIVAIYTIEGHRIAELQPGVNIIRLSNGSTRKVLVRE